MTSNSDSRLEREVEFQDSGFDSPPTIGLVVNEDSGQGQLQFRDRFGESVNMQVNNWVLESQKEIGRINQRFRIGPKDEENTKENGATMNANENPEREGFQINNTYLAISQIAFLILGLGAIIAAVLVQNTVVGLLATFAVPILFALAFLGVLAERTTHKTEF